MTHAQFINKDKQALGNNKIYNVVSDKITTIEVKLNKRTF